MRGYNDAVKRFALILSWFACAVILIGGAHVHFDLPSEGGCAVCTLADQPYSATTDSATVLADSLQSDWLRSDDIAAVEPNRNRRQASRAPPERC